MGSGTRAAAFGLVLIATGIGAARLPVSAQAARSDDVLPALLVEIKGLRAAMEQMASGGTQAQILVGRLQVQESRLTTMIDRLETVHDSLESARQEYETARDTLQQVEKAGTAVAFSHDNPYDNVPDMKREVATTKARVDRLVAEELQLSSDVAVEQQRWTAINQRLEELERALSKR